MSNKSADIKNINDSIDETIEEIRNITHNLSTQIVGELGLETSISQVLSEAARALNGDFELKYDIDETSLDQFQKRMLYRIAQEAMSNCIKYSKATLIYVSMEYLNDQIHYIIKDNGIGFDPTEHKNGIGIHNIKERVSILSGYFRLISQPGVGTEIRIRIPPTE